MARQSLVALLCAAILANAAPPETSPADSAREPRLETALAVQKALREGREQLQRGNYQGAVYLLESQIARINGNGDYLAALTEAYRGYVAELRKAGRDSEIPKYRDRLLILDPATTLGGARVATAAPVTPPKAPVQPTALAKSDDDPFADSNAVATTAPALSKAEEAYVGRQYPTAAQLFDRAVKQGETLSDANREHYGYCKLVAIADTLRKPDAVAAPAELEREVRQAIAISPKLDSFGNELLKQLQEHGPTATTSFEVRHTAAQSGTWAVAETPNFRILHTQSREVAEQIARSAEATRSAMIRKWFGDDVGPWTPRCEVYLHATVQDYSQATGAPTTSPGHSTIRSEGERILGRRIDLHCDDANMTIGVLPHETTHVVLAGRFGAHAVPRWADEGMAVLAEPRERIDLHLRNLPRHRAEKQLFGTSQLMKLDAYPDPRYIGSFYAQSVSLVDFLSQRSGPRVFAQFLKEALDTGYEGAVLKHYGFRSFVDLEQEWLTHAMGQVTQAGYRQP